MIAATVTGLVPFSGPEPEAGPGFAAEAGAGFAGDWEEALAGDSGTGAGWADVGQCAAGLVAAVLARAGALPAGAGGAEVLPAEVTEGGDGLGADAAGLSGAVSGGGPLVAAPAAGWVEGRAGEGMVPLHGLAVGCAGQEGMESAADGLRVAVFGLGAPSSDGIEAAARPDGPERQAGWMPSSITVETGGAELTAERGTSGAGKVLTRPEVPVAALVMGEMAGEGDGALGLPLDFPALHVSGVGQVLALRAVAEGQLWVGAPGAPQAAPREAVREVIRLVPDEAPVDAMDDAAGEPAPVGAAGAAVGAAGQVVSAAPRLAGAGLAPELAGERNGRGEVVGRPTASGETRVTKAEAPELRGEGGLRALGETSAPERVSTFERVSEGGIVGLVETVARGAERGEVRGQLGAAAGAGLVPQVAAVLAEAARDHGAGPVTLTLAPDELGQVRFEMQGKGEALHVVLTVERPETLDLLRRNAEQLVAEFRQAGFAAASFAFSGGAAGGGSHGAFGGGPERPPAYGAGEREKGQRPGAGRAARHGAGLDVRI